jgi:Flp pilus assembly protein TadG
MRNPFQTGTKLLETMRNAVRHQDGSVSLLFGLSLLPLIAGAGLAIDYSRASDVRSAMQNAVDSTVLAMAKRSPTLSDTDLQREAARHFAAVYTNRHGIAHSPIRVTRTRTAMRVEASSVVPTKLMRAFGTPALQVATAGEASISQRRVELALALDNTGSMGRLSKMEELKKATRNLIDAAEKAAPRGSGMIKIAMVPFDTEIKINPNGYRERSWLAFRDDAGHPSFDRIRPQMATKTDWTGCITDRGTGFDASERRSDLARPESLHPAVTCSNAQLARVQPLTDDWNALRNIADSMRPSGCTNITIGARWGLATLSPSEPIGGGVAFGTDNVDKYLVILTDGNNTRNRFTSVGCGSVPANGTEADIDARTRTMCNEIKGKSSRLDAAGRAIPDVKVFTIRVMEGNQALLRGCATDASMYKEVNNAADIDKVFKDIMREITNLRLTM